MGASYQKRSHESKLRWLKKSIFSNSLLEVFQQEVSFQKKNQDLPENIKLYLKTVFLQVASRRSLHCHSLLVFGHWANFPMQTLVIHQSTYHFSKFHWIYIHPQTVPEKWMGQYHELLGAIGCSPHSRKGHERDVFNENTTGAYSSLRIETHRETKAGTS